MPTTAYVAIAFVIGLAVGLLLAFARSRGYLYQNPSEKHVSEAIRDSFAAPDYHLLNHITLPLDDGSTQIDHILVSRFGVFVIETKGYTGWIFSNPTQASWTQVIFKSKFRFQNPIFQNLRHVRAVQRLLDFLPPEVVRSVVVFAGNAEFKTAIPEGVFDLPDMVDHIRGQRSEVMSLNRVQFCVGRLETARLAISGETDVQHVENLRRRHGGR